MLVKKLWRLAGMLICLLCLTGGLCSAFLSGFGIRYLVPVFWMFLIVSVLFWIGFSRLPLEGVYRLLAILGTLIGVSLLLLLLQKDVIAGYMSAVNGVRSRLNEAYDGTLALYQASASAMQMTVDVYKRQTTGTATGSTTEPATGTATGSTTDPTTGTATGSTTGSATDPGTGTETGIVLAGLATTAGKQPTANMTVTNTYLEKLNLKITKEGKNTTDAVSYTHLLLYCEWRR